MLLKFTKQFGRQNKNFTLSSCVKAFSSQAAINLKNDDAEINQNDNLQNVRPFEEIPGPSKFEFLRAFLPGGINYKKSMTDTMLNFESLYGSLYRFPGIFGNSDIIICLNPEDYPIIFRHEGKWPNRKSLDTLIFHREKHREEFFNGTDGVFSTNGEKWAKIRTIVNPILMQPKNSILYLDAMLEVNDEFLKRIREVRDSDTHEMPDDFEDDLNRLTFETVAAVALDTQLGLLRKNRDTTEAKIIFNSIKKFFDLAFELEVLPSFWRIIKTPKFYEMMKALDSLTDECKKYIDEALTKIEQSSNSKNERQESVVEKLAKIDKKIAVVMALDMMMAGVDTTSSTLTGILLCLAKNPTKQEKLFEELKGILPEKDSKLNMDNMRSLPYLRACIKEGIRVYPIITGTIRNLPVDVILSGYHVKAGTDITISSNILLSNEKYVPRPSEYLPERWIRSENANNNLFGQLDNPFLYLPFGFGPRSCVGKRIVNLELEITIARLVRNFNIEYNYSTENAFKQKMISIPNIPLKFKFEERMK